MSYNTTQGRTEYIANEGQDLFPFTFKIYFNNDLKVYLTPVGQHPNDESDILILNTDYTVTITGDLGGSISLTNPTTAGDKVTLIRSLDINRLIEYQTSGDLLADTLNADQEYQTYLISDQNVKSYGYLSVPTSSQGVSTFLPDVVPDAYLKWNSAGDSIINDDAVSQAYIRSQQEAWKAEASKMTADSYATEPENVLVKRWVSDGDGTFTPTDTTEYSSLHWAGKAYTNTSLDGLTDVSITTPSPGESLIYNPTTSGWENGKVLGMPIETGKKGQSVTNNGVEGDSYWSPMVHNPQSVNSDITLTGGDNASMVSPTVEDGSTITIEDGSKLVIL